VINLLLYGTTLWEPQ